MWEPLQHCLVGPSVTETLHTLVSSMMAMWPWGHCSAVMAAGHLNMTIITKELNFLFKLILI